MADVWRGDGEAKRGYAQSRTPSSPTGPRSVTHYAGIASPMSTRGSAGPRAVCMEIGAPTPALIYLAADSFVILVDEPGGISDRCLKGAPKYSLHYTTWRFGARRVTRCCGNGKVGPRAFTCNFNGFASLSSVQSPYRAGYRISGLRQISSTDKANLGIATHRDAASTVGCDHRNRWGSPVSMAPWPLSPKTPEDLRRPSAFGY